ncbi:hypothetical protein [Paracidovorax cattleyae]|uniref:Uncharacterized protein n=1 Tax=Paracidovorax cattleyae TaxID=80868 RepID=A0A1H0U335_9BURK|nr:hypothetical protein [Paracidovorax cattleyae]SDP60460.1 hypothetical protein SAMN04489708_11793 [Paracidovorax cattleyae]
MQKRTWTDAQRALENEFERVERKEKENSAKDGRKEKKVKLAIEKSTVIQVIRDVLSLPENVETPGTKQEHLLLEQIVCLMNFHNRKWMREIQVAFSYMQMIGDDIPGEAEIKLRVTLSELDEAKERGRIVDLRNYFCKLLRMCIPGEEQVLHDELEDFLNKYSVADARVEVLESAAYNVATSFQSAFYECKRSIRPRPVRVDCLSDESHRHRYPNLLDQYIKISTQISGRDSFRIGLAAEDSLFTRLYLNASLNRFLLEQWAYEWRARKALPVQVELVKSLESSGCQIISTLGRHINDGVVCYPEVVKEVLAETLQSAGGAERVLTSNVLERIGEQVCACQASALLPEFRNEHGTNEFMLKYPPLSCCLWWIVLTWCYLHKSTLPNDDARVHSSLTRPISKRSKIVVGGQQMSSLRRLFSTLFYSYQFVSPSVKRLHYHADHVAGVKKVVNDFVGMELKTASLHQLRSGVEKLIAGVVPAVR